MRSDGNLLGERCRCNRDITVEFGDGRDTCLRTAFWSTRAGETDLCTAFREVGDGDTTAFREVIVGDDGLCNAFRALIELDVHIATELRAVVAEVCTALRSVSTARDLDPAEDLRDAVGQLFWAPWIVVLFFSAKTDRAAAV